MFRKPSLRLFDSYFAILTGMSVAFLLLFNIVALLVKLCSASMDNVLAIFTSAFVFVFVFVMGWLTACAAVALSKRKRRPRWSAIATFPVFSLILSASVLYTLVFPTRRWKPIPHGSKVDDNIKISQ